MPESAEATETLEASLARNFESLSEETTEEINEPSSVVEAEPEQESLDPLEPLEKWPDEFKSSFSELNREAQQFILDRHKELEGDYTKKTQELSDVRNRYERIDKVLEPYAQVLDKQGVDLTPHLGSALQAYFSFMQNPAETLRTLISQAHLTQDQLFEDDTTDPDIRALRSELNQYKQELASLREAPDRSAERQLEEFRSATNEDGSPKYPYFEQLRASMAPLVNDGKSLDDAYKEALWMVPEYRKSQMESEKKEALKAQEAERLKKVDKAKKAADTLPSGDVDTRQGLPKMKGWEGALRHTLSELGGN